MREVLRKSPEAVMTSRKILPALSVRTDDIIFLLALPLIINKIEKIRPVSEVFSFDNNASEYPSDATYGNTLGVISKMGEWV